MFNISFPDSQLTFPHRRQRNTIHQTMRRVRRVILPTPVLSNHDMVSARVSQ